MSEKEERQIADTKLLYMSLMIRKAPDSFPGTVFEINALGYKYSKRDKKDSLTYVGHFDYAYTSEEIINDIVFPSRLKKHGQHFCISYEWNSNLYYIRDLNFGLYRKIHSFVSIKENMLVQANSNFFMFSVKEDFLEIKYNSEVVRFDKEKEVVTIGRSSECSIAIEDKSLSRHQMSILYKEDEWVIFDGNHITREPSKNGTWLLLKEPIRVLNGMVLKSGDITFETKLFTLS